jgi:hypothetical protein
VLSFEEISNYQNVAFGLVYYSLNPKLEVGGHIINKPKLMANLISGASKSSALHRVGL